MEKKTDMRYIGVKVEVGLYEILEEYKEERRIRTVSEAVRTILRTYLLDIYPKEKAGRVGKVAVSEVDA